MEYPFGKKVVSCLDPVIRDVQNCEQSQQIRLSDGLPDIGSILSAWGQVILRGKEWHGDAVSLSGGMMVWVLYAPEDGSQARCIDTWIPFQMKWELPEGIPEGNIRIRCLTRFVDGRSVSPRKIQVRCGIGALAEVFVPMEQEVFLPEQNVENVELLKPVYPVRLAKEAGEKVFLMEETLPMPESVPQPEKLIFCRMEPKIGEKKVISDKIVFRGSGEVHMLYRSDEGQLHSWDFSVPFSQYDTLDREHGADARVDLVPAVTALETELDDEGHLRLKCGITAQYVVTDREMLELVEDAYSPDRELTMEREELLLPVLLEETRETVMAEQTLPAEANLAVDVSFLPDFPRQYTRGNELELEIPGSFHCLYYGEDSALHSASARWEGHKILPADENSRIQAVPQAAQAQASVGNGQIQVKAEIPMDMTASTRQQFSMITAVQTGQQRVPDPGRPTLILCRPGNKRLWDLAKDSGSTMEAIRQANKLSGEPDPEQMLLIPVS